MGLYIVPAAGTGTSADPRRPAYIPGNGVPWYGQPFGVGDCFIVQANLSPAQETSLAAQPNAFIVPALNSLLTAADASAMTTRLEARGLPGQWVIAGDTWKRTMRLVVILCHHADTISETLPSLDATYASLTTAQKAKLQAAADTVGYDTSGLTGTTLVRWALYQFALAWPRRVFVGSTDL